MPYTDDICQREDKHDYAQRKILEFLREERENKLLTEKHKMLYTTDIHNHDNKEAEKEKLTLMSAPRTNQPPPKQSTGDCWKNLIERYSEDNVYNTDLHKQINISELVSLNRLMFDRRKLGIERYNTVLQPFNGRDCVRDLLEEQLDSLAYSEQVSLEFPELKELILDWQKFTIDYMSKLIEFKERK